MDDPLSPRLGKYMIGENKTIGTKGEVPMTPISKIELNEVHFYKGKHLYFLIYFPIRLNKQELNIGAS